MDRLPEVGDILQGAGYWEVVTSVDRTDWTITTRVFKTLDLAQTWLHEVSKKQFPEYHATYCVKCKELDK